MEPTCRAAHPGRLYLDYSTLDDETIIRNTQELINQIRTSNAPEFVRERVGLMETLIGMIVDPHWALQPQDRPKIIQALAYFSEPDDLIPDEIPGLGFLDDAWQAWWLYHYADVEDPYGPPSVGRFIVDLTNIG